MNGRAEAVWTIGHSTRSGDELISLLQACGIKSLGDVRRFPASRRHPQFNRSALESSIAEASMHYAWFEALGGRRSARKDSHNTAWHNASFRGYADYMQTPEFGAALDELILLFKERRTVYCCTEAVFWRCHRQLTSDALVVRSFRVGHIFTATKVEEHTLTKFAKAEGTRLTYPSLL